MVPNLVVVVSGKGSVVSLGRVEGSFGIDSAKSLVDRVGLDSIGRWANGREGGSRKGARGEEEGGGDELHGEFGFGRQMCEKGRKMPKGLSNSRIIGRER